MFQGLVRGNNPDALLDYVSKESELAKSYHFMMKRFYPLCFECDSYA